MRPIFIIGPDYWVRSCCIIDTLIGIGILLAVFVILFSLMYWLSKQLYKNLKPTINNSILQKDRLDSLEKRVELLERKLDNK
ncbi:hypothetical protein J22TS1_20530 [Siminovitchia terrae]|nr:hypothetical protein J22TS1_20530 [Siminovitchia terrae]